MNYVGIDIGKSGYIISITPDGIIKYPIPLIGDKVDSKALSEIIELGLGNERIVGMEDLHSIYGVSASSNYSFGWINGLIEGILTSFKVPFVKIQAKKWQKEMFEGIPTQFKNKKVDTKVMSIMASKRLFPSFDLKATERSRTDNHNVSDALLIAEYIRRKYNNRAI